MKTLLPRPAAGLALAALLALTGCFTEYQAPPLEGERIPVLVNETGLRPDPGMESVAVTVAPPVENAGWTTGGGNSRHALYHAALPANPREAWRADIGDGADDEVRLLAQPVVDGRGRVFTLDVEATLTAFDAATGDRLWERELPQQDTEGTLGGGLAVAGGKVVATTGFAQVIGLDAVSGEVLWRQSVAAPIRSAPTVGEGRVFVVSIDNQTHALELDTGKVAWTHRGATELASLLGGASPAYDSGTVVVAYSTGELFALRGATGTELWTDYLSRAMRTTGVGRISDIRAAPVIDRGRVFAVSNAGRFVAFSLANGQRLWEHRVSGTHMPWAAGPFLYLITSDYYLVCLSRDDGSIRWVRGLPRWEDPEDREGLIVWTGPVLAGDRLILAGTNEEVLAVSPYSGDLLGLIDVDAPVSVPPVVAGGTLYILTDDADLIAWR